MGALIPSMAHNYNVIKILVIDDDHCLWHELMLAELRALVYTRLDVISIVALSCTSKTDLAQTRHERGERYLMNDRMPRLGQQRVSRRILFDLGIQHKGYIRVRSTEKDTYTGWLCPLGAMLERGELDLVRWYRKHKLPLLPGIAMMDRPREYRCVAHALLWKGDIKVMKYFLNVIKPPLTTDALTKNQRHARVPHFAACWELMDKYIKGRSS